MTTARLDIPPGPGFVTTVAAATGIHHANGYTVAQLLITHPGPRRMNETAETVADGMHRLATALHLGPGAQEPPGIGAQLMIRRGFAALDYGHDQYVMTIPSPSQDWLALVGHGALCRICLVLAPSHWPPTRPRPMHTYAPASPAARSCGGQRSPAGGSERP